MCGVLVCCVVLRVGDCWCVLFDVFVVWRLAVRVHCCRALFVAVGWCVLIVVIVRSVLHVV